MNVIERIIFYIDSIGISRSAFEKKVPLPNAYISKIKTSPSIEKLEDILRTFPDMNRDWLLYGEGEMLKNEAKEKKNEKKIKEDETIPLLPISAQGGSLDDFVSSIRSSDCERIISPIAGVDFAISIAGDSMAPEYPSGSQVLVKKINEQAFIEWGKVYVLDTCNGSIIKKLMPGEGNNSVQCVSINERYPPFDVDRVDIYGIYRVLMLMAVK